MVALSGVCHFGTSKAIGLSGGKQFDWRFLKTFLALIRRFKGAGSE
jgi:hypothetical protein